MKLQSIAAIALLTGWGSAPAASPQALTTADIAAARKLYEVKCAKCHKFYEPKDYSQGEWNRWMTSMSRKSRLKPDQARILNQYLDDYRRRGEFPR